MRVLDDRLMNFNVRHCDPTLPRKRFSAGASTIAMFNASEFCPLVWQTMVVVGADPTDESILTHENKKKVVKCFYKLLALRNSLTKKIMTENDINKLSREITR